MPAYQIRQNLVAHLLEKVKTNISMTNALLTVLLNLSSLLTSKTVVG